MNACKNSTGPKYTIYESNTNHKVGLVKSSSLGTVFQIIEIANGIKTEVVGVNYEPNFLGHNGPRKMNVLIPAMQPDGGRVNIAATKPLQTVAKSGNDKIIHLCNKIPQWNDETQSFVLNFNGRVNLASVKNFQIVHDMDLEHIVLQFGRVTLDEFSVDVQYPFSLLQAFGIALTSFDSKVACE